MLNKHKLFFLLFFSTALLAKSQTAVEIMNNHFEAIGGIKKIKGISSVKKIFATDNEIAGSGTVIAVEDMGLFTESKSGLFGESRQIVNKKKGWNIVKTPFDEKPEIKEMDETDHNLAFPSGFYDIQELLPEDKLITIARYGTTNYNTLELLGKETINGKECFKLKVKSYTYEGTWYFDSSTWYCVRMVTEEKKNEKIVRDFSDFRRNAHGCIFPYKETILGNDGKALVTTTYSEFETNFKADKNIFNYKG